jgi:hypothetical protein
MKLFLGVLLFLSLAPLSKSAERFDGNALLAQCKNVDSHPESYEAGLCSGYVSGVHFGHSFTAVMYKLKSSYCMPKDVTFDQTSLVVLKYLNEHPESLHLPAHELVLASLIRAFPCPVAPEKPKK